MARGPPRGLNEVVDQVQDNGRFLVGGDDSAEAAHLLLMHFQKDRNAASCWLLLPYYPIRTLKLPVCRYPRFPARSSVNVIESLKRVVVIRVRHGGQRLTRSERSRRLKPLMFSEASKSMPETGPDGPVEPALRWKTTEKPIEFRESCGKFTVVL